MGRISQAAVGVHQGFREKKVSPFQDFSIFISGMFDLGRTGQRAPLAPLSLMSGFRRLCEVPHVTS